MKTITIAILLLVVGCGADYDPHKQVACDGVAWHETLPQYNVVWQTCEQECEQPFGLGSASAGHETRWCWAVIHDANVGSGAPFVVEIPAQEGPTGLWGFCEGIPSTGPGQQSVYVEFAECVKQPPPPCHQQGDIACEGPEPKP